ncbi:phosphoribosylamine--glycine ligase, partial [bacterium]|nr:phosphoribosylamine--glycine ligase [bacterium]
MNIMVIGSGGREHAIGVALSKSPRSPQLFFLPGNPGTARLGINIECDVMDTKGIVDCARSLGVDMVVVGPEGPLVAGLADELVAAGIPTVGPGREAAQLEGSKAWAKAKMKTYGIPTASYDVYTDYASALTRVQQGPFPLVIKA